MGRLWGLGFKVNEVGVTLDSWILWQAESDADDPKILLALQAKDTFHFDVLTKVKKVDRRQCGTPFRRRTRSNTSHVLTGRGRSMDLIGRCRLFRPFRPFRLFTSLITSPMSSWMLAFCRKSLRDVSRCSTLTWIAEKKFIDFQHWEPIQGIITPAVLESWCCGRARSWQSKPWPCVVFPCLFVAMFLLKHLGNSTCHQSWSAVFTLCHTPDCKDCIQITRDIRTVKTTSLHPSDINRNNWNNQKPKERETRFVGLVVIRG